MAWTYDPADLDDPIYAVRLTIGDTNPNDPQMQDEEIQSLLDLTGNSVASASAKAARALAARYARSVDKWVGDLKILASQRQRHYLNLSEELEGASALGHGVPSAGGIRVSQKESMEANDDLVQPFFRRGMHDNRESD